MATEVTQKQIEAVLGVIRTQTPDRHLQLTLMTACLVLLCRNYGIMRSSLFDRIKDLYGRPAEVRPAAGIAISGKNDNATETTEAS